MSLYAVNGKEPIAAWIPSRDTAGNGTSTLTDLVGSNNGTLTNMDPATDWVADTDAGGVRALDFDGVNDFVATTLNAVDRTNFSLSAWVYPRLSANAFFFSQRGAGGNQWQLWGGGDRGISFWNGTTIVGGPINQLVVNQWQNLLSVRTETNVSIFRNGLLVNSFTSAIPAASTSTVSLNTDSGTTFGNSRLDDIRIFNTALNADDVAYLYNSGNGRGRLATTQSRRRRDLGGFGL